MSLIDDVAGIDSNPQLATAAAAHVMRMPLHGPFAYLSAAAMAEQLSTHFSGRFLVTPNACLEYCMKYWETDHLRQWPVYYAAGELRPEEVEQL